MYLHEIITTNKTNFYRVNILKSKSSCKIHVLYKYKKDGKNGLSASN